MSVSALNMLKVFPETGHGSFNTRGCRTIPYWFRWRVRGSLPGHWSVTLTKRDKVHVDWLTPFTIFIKKRRYMYSTRVDKFVRILYTCAALCAISTNCLLFSYTLQHHCKGLVLCMLHIVLMKVWKYAQWFRRTCRLLLWKERFCTKQTVTTCTCIRRTWENIYSLCYNRGATWVWKQKPSTYTWHNNTTNERNITACRFWHMVLILVSQ